MRSAILPVLLLGILGLIPQNAFAQQWGTVKGRFVVQGELENRAALALPVAVAPFCGAGLPNPGVQVDNKGNLKNVAVWLHVDRNAEAPQPHPSYAAKAKEKVVIDNKACVYDPHVVAVMVDQPVEFTNSDPVPHNFKIEGFKNNGLNQLVPINGAFPHKFTQEERYPMNASCAIHPWMVGKIIVRESPYMAVSGADGTFTIENLPVGKHKLQIWHEVPGNVKEMIVAGKPYTDRRGLLEIDVKAGENDLGDLKINADQFDK